MGFLPAFFLKKPTFVHKFNKMHDPKSFSELVDSAAQLDTQDYEKFLKTVSARRVQALPNVLPKNETDLLNKIYKTFPVEKKARLQELNDRIRDADFSETEHLELLQLVELHEKWAAKRMASLAELAALRNTDYASLILQLGIRPAPQNA